MHNNFKIDFELAKKSAEIGDKISSITEKHGNHQGLKQLVGEVESFAEEAKPGRAFALWSQWLAAARCSIATEALSMAIREGRGVADAKIHLDLLYEDFFGLLGISDSPQSPNSSRRDLVAAILKMQLPILYWGSKRERDRSRCFLPIDSVLANVVQEEQIPQVARLIVHIENSPLVSPQEVRPRTLYRVRLEAHLSYWPSNASSLSYRFTTTLANTQYDLSHFEAITPQKRDEENCVLCADGNLSFPYGQNDPFSPIVFGVSAFLMLDEKTHPVRLVGHDQLQFRVRDQSQTLLSSGFPRMDSHLHDLAIELCTKQPTVRDELVELLPLLDALTCLLGTFAQGGVLKGRIDVHESEFQSEVLKLLRMKLGQDVQEGPKQAGGITDIRFRGCIVELKVEGSISDRDQLFEKYAAQPTQYQRVEARSVAILLVLDLSEKAKPTGDIRNDVMLGKVKTHGGDGKYPSWAFLFIVRGNVKSPSSYST